MACCPNLKRASIGAQLLPLARTSFLNRVRYFLVRITEGPHYHNRNARTLLAKLRLLPSLTSLCRSLPNVKIFFVGQCFNVHPRRGGSAMNRRTRVCQSNAVHIGKRNLKRRAGLHSLQLLKNSFH